MAKYDLKQGMEKIRAKYGWNFAPAVSLPKSPWSKFKTWMKKSAKIFIKPEWAPWRKESSPDVKSLIEDDAREVFNNYYSSGGLDLKFFQEKMQEKGWTQEAIKGLGRKMEEFVK